MADDKIQDFSGLSKDELHNRIRDLEHELRNMSKLQKQLVQTEKLAALGGLVSGVAHEINNPLAIISGYSELLLNDTDLSSKHSKKIKKIYDSGIRCAKIVRNLLGFARETDIVNEDLNVHDVLDDALAMREYEFSVNNISIIRQYAPDMPDITGDRQLLQQIFINFINNAFDAMHEKHRRGTLTIRTRRDETWAVIEIIDDGPGIPEEIRDRLFDPFFTTKMPGKGTGLGLSLSFGIIGEHGGRVFLDDEYHGGAKFVIKFPAAVTGKSDSRKNTTELSKESEGGKALIVDDEVEIVNLMREIFQLRDRTVDVAGSGEEAIELLKKNRYAMAMLDIRMPGAVDGMDLYRHIQEHHDYLNGRILFVTGDSVSGDIKAFMKKNNVNCIQKPFQIQELIVHIDNFLRKFTAV